MSISPAEFLASEQASKFPDWIKQNPAWKNYPTLDKAFPAIGLTNCREPHPTEIMDLDTNTFKRMDICFSSDGVEGLWDIATMSMRGVLSCRHWDNPHAKCIVSEITNPNIGIVYFTDGTMTDYGLSINKRALVRYVPQRLGVDPCSYIYLDTLYAKTTNRDPFQYLNKDPNSEFIRDIFKAFLKSKLNNHGKANVSIR